jgi:hypothetical protein
MGLLKRSKHVRSKKENILKGKRVFKSARTKRKNGKEPRHGNEFNSNGNSGQSRKKRRRNGSRKIASPLKEKSKQALDVLKGKADDLVDQSGKKAVQRIETQKFASNVPTGRVADAETEILKAFKKQPHKARTLNSFQKQALEKLLKHVKKNQE